MNRIPRISLWACALVVVWAPPNSSHAASLFERSGTFVQGDFDGDGLTDVAVSAPESDCGKGIIYVRSGSGGTVEWTRDSAGVLGTAACDDHFGASLAVGDFDGDGYDDLAAGAPGAADSGSTDAGVVHVLYGSSSGLSSTGDQMWYQDVSGIADTSEASDYFGDSLSTGDYNCDGYDELAIGIPREDIGANIDVGAVSVLYGRSSGLTSVDDFWYQGAGGVDDSAEANDHFGAALASGNFNGDSHLGIECVDLAISAPDEDSRATDAGFVYLMFGDAIAGLTTINDQSIDQDMSGVEDTAEAGDHLGFRLASVDLDSDGYDDLRVTVPGDGCTAAHGLGRHTFHGSATGLSTTDDSVDCDQFGCTIEGGFFVCPSTLPVDGTDSADTMSLMFEDDVGWGFDGVDNLRAAYGDDVLFGGAGDDRLEGGGGADILIGGLGDDSFWIDQDCEIDADDIVDGGPGTDTVYSHKTEAQLTALGVELNSIESFVVISSPTVDAWGDCAAFPYDIGRSRPTSLELSWQQLPAEGSSISTTTGLLTLDVENHAAITRSFVVAYTLVVGSTTLTIEELSTQLAPSASTSFTLDLNDYIPTGIDPQTVDPSLLAMSSSAWLRASATVTVGGDPVEIALAPILFGHASDTDTLQIYRRGAMNTSYCGGDLATCARSSTGGTSAYSGATDAWGVAQ